MVIESSISDIVQIVANKLPYLSRANVRKSSNKFNIILRQLGYVPANVKMLCLEQAIGHPVLNFISMNMADGSTYIISENVLEKFVEVCVRPINGKSQVLRMRASYEEVVRQFLRSVRPQKCFFLKPELQNEKNTELIVSFLQKNIPWLRNCGVGVIAFYQIEDLQVMLSKLRHPNVICLIWKYYALGVKAGSDDYSYLAHGEALCDGSLTSAQYVALRSEEIFAKDIAALRTTILRDELYKLPLTDIERLKSRKLTHCRLYDLFYSKDELSLRIAMEERLHLLQIEIIDDDYADRQNLQFAIEKLYTTANFLFSSDLSASEEAKERLSTQFQEVMRDAHRAFQLSAASAAHRRAVDCELTEELGESVPIQLNEQVPIDPRGRDQVLLPPIEDNLPENQDEEDAAIQDRRVRDPSVGHRPYWGVICKSAYVRFGLTKALEEFLGLDYTDYITDNKKPSFALRLQNITALADTTIPAVREAKRQIIYDKLRTEGITETDDDSDRFDRERDLIMVALRTIYKNAYLKYVPRVTPFSTVPHIIALIESMTNGPSSSVSHQRVWNVQMVPHGIEALFSIVESFPFDKESPIIHRDYLIYAIDRKAKEHAGDIMLIFENQSNIYICQNFARDYKEAIQFITQHNNMYPVLHHNLEK